MRATLPYNIKRMVTEKGYSLSFGYGQKSSKGLVTYL